jgi:hypothetical protein
MKTRIKTKLIALACTFALVFAVEMHFSPKVSAQAQSSATPTQQTSTELRAAVVAGTSATSAATITLTPPGSLNVYITEVDIQNCAGASAVTAAAPTTVSTTNITGSPAFTVGSGLTAGLCTNQVITYPTGLKSTTPGTAVTYVLPTFATNQTIRVNVAGYYAQ